MISRAVPSCVLAALALVAVPQTLQVVQRRHRGFRR